MGLDEAYKVLGVESSVSIEEVCKVENSHIYMERETLSVFAFLFVSSTTPLSYSGWVFSCSTESKDDDGS